MNWRLPISIKGILFNSQEQVLLFQNDRGSWELPGGRIDPGEQPEQTLRREFMEEAGLCIEVGSIIASWVYEVLPTRFVFIVAYACSFDEDQDISISNEHVKYGWFGKDDLDELPLDDGYIKAILRTATMLEI